MEKKQFQNIVKKLVKDAITKYLKEKVTLPLPDDLPNEFLTKRGVFVTLRTKKGHNLRGCIGRPYPESPLAVALIHSAISSAVGDPRFPSVKYDELEKLSFEVSILSEPILIQVNDAKKYLDKIIIGKHGLIAENDYARGLLLPQVATQYNWNSKQFLEQTCRKAGLYVNDWKKPNTNIYSFYLYDLIEGDFTS